MGTMKDSKQWSVLTGIKQRTQIMELVRVQVPCRWWQVYVCYYSYVSITILHGLGIDPCYDSVDKIVKALRKVVDEWTRDHLLDLCYRHRSKKAVSSFLKVMNSLENLEIYIIVIAALSDILHSPIELFQSLICQSLWYLQAMMSCTILI